MLNVPALFTRSTDCDANTEVVYDGLVEDPKSCCSSSSQSRRSLISESFSLGLHSL